MDKQAALNLVLEGKCPIDLVKLLKVKPELLDKVWGCFEEVADAEDAHELFLRTNNEQVAIACVKFLLTKGDHRHLDSILRTSKVDWSKYERFAPAAAARCALAKYPQRLQLVATVVACCPEESANALKILLTVENSSALSFYALEDITSFPEVQEYMRIHDMDERKSALAALCE